MAAMKNVLSPNSVNNITDIDAVNASRKPPAFKFDEVLVGSTVGSSVIAASTKILSCLGCTSAEIFYK